MNKNFTIAIKRLSNAIFTNRCEFCGEVIELDEIICSKCKRLPSIKEPRCKYCGVQKEICRCKHHKNEFKDIVAPYYYADSVTTAVNRFKSSDMPFLSTRLAKDMANCILEKYSDIAFDVITFVPMSKRAERSRGYNQSQLLATEIGKRLNIEVKPLIKKIIDTEPQKEQTAKQRKVNLFGAFDVIDKDYVNDKTILLIDDVKTTGSTLNECAKMLNIYGAKAVYVAALAVVLNDKK